MTGKGAAAGVAAPTASAPGSEPNSATGTPVAGTSTLQPANMHLHPQGSSASSSSGHGSPQFTGSAIATAGSGQANVMHPSSPYANSHPGGLGVTMMNALLSQQKQQQSMQSIPINGHASHHASPMQLPVPLHHSRNGSLHNTPKIESADIHTLSQAASRMSSH